MNNNWRGIQTRQWSTSIGKRFVISNQFALSYNMKTMVDIAPALLKNPRKKKKIVNQWDRLNSSTIDIAHFGLEFENHLV